MRTLVLVVAAVILTVFLLPSTASSAPPPPAAASLPELSLTVEGFQNGTAYQFSPSQILVPQVPIIMNITFHNNQSLSGPSVHHTFSINNNAGMLIVDYDLAPQQNVTFNMTINSMTNISWNGTSFTPEAGPTGGIRFYCVYHLPNMVGEIVLAGAPSTGAQAQKGVFLRAYWIGMIGIASMLVWVGISYFVIKSSSPHFKDHREHVRKGLP